MEQHATDGTAAPGPERTSSAAPGSGIIDTVDEYKEPDALAVALPVLIESIQTHLQCAEDGRKTHLQRHYHASVAEALCALWCAQLPGHTPEMHQLHGQSMSARHRIEANIIANPKKTIENKRR